MELPDVNDMKNIGIKLFTLFCKLDRFRGICKMCTVTKSVKFTHKNDHIYSKTDQLLVSMLGVGGNQPI